MVMRLFRRNHTEPAQPVPAITVEELRQRLERHDTMVVLDVRQPHAYSEYPGEIPGSVCIPPAELPDRYGELPRDRLIVAYCT